MFIYEDEALKDIPHIRHGFFGRTGGISDGLFKSLNVGFSSQDDRDNIIHNRGVIKQKLGASKLATTQQVHGADIINIGGQNAEDQPRPQADGMVSQHKNIAIGILTADCVPILAADRTKPVVGAAHSGWGGAFKGVGEHLIKRMIANGAKEKDIVVALGPCIQQNSYEVDQTFYDRFMQASSENTAFFKKGDRAGHYLFNLPSYASRQIQKFFPKLYSVSISSMDTYSLKSKFFSYRRSTHYGDDDYGRQMSAITLI